MHLALTLSFLAALPHAQDGAAKAGREARPSSRHASETLSPECFGPAIVESMEDVLARASRARVPADPRARHGAPGEWTVPERDGARAARSGERYAYNSWGDTRLGIGFGREVSLQGVWISRHGDDGATTSGLEVVGYLDGEEVGRSAPFQQPPAKPTWWALELPVVDRIVFLAEPVVGGAGWFAIDDLTFEVAEDGQRRTRVVDFEDLGEVQKLTGSGYFGLDWEAGSGDFEAKARPTAPVPGEAPAQRSAGSGGTAARSQNPNASPAPPAAPAPPSPLIAAPQLGIGLAGPTNNDVGSLTVPDTNGAVGPDHYVAAPNGHLAIYARATGQKVFEVAQTTFFAASGFIGDPRIAYDAGEDRFVLLASDWDSRVHLAVSMTSDPTGAWFKTSFLVAQGADAGAFPDYPTLGIDENGIYTSLYMAPGGLSLFAIDKQPLLASAPSLGTVTAWRSLPLEGTTPLESAIQPCITFGSSGGVYLVAASGSQALRIRQVTGSLTSPTLVEKGLVTVPAFVPATDAPQPGTGVRLSASKALAMNAVYRSGSLWTVHCVDVDGRAALRWYEVDPEAPRLVQSGTVADPVRSFIFPSISANAEGDMLIGFTGSSPVEYASAYAVGRRAGYPSGATSAPVLLQAGQSRYTYLNSQGVSRWGDYSMTGVDPADDRTFWTIQQYAEAPNRWRLWIQALSY